MRVRFIFVNSSYVIYLNYSIQLFDFQCKTRHNCILFRIWNTIL